MTAKKICYFDFETGGLDPYKGSEPIELAAIMLDAETLEEIDRFPARLMRVQKSENLGEIALKVNGKTVEQIMSAEDPKAVFSDFADWVSSHLDPTQASLPNRERDRVLLAGHNVKFDIAFLKVAFDQYLAAGEKVYDYLFDYHDICSFSLGYPKKVLINKIMEKGSLVNFTKHYGIPHNAHEAMGDVEAGVEVLRRLFAEMRAEHNALVLQSVRAGAFT